MNLWKRIKEWGKYAKDHPWQAVGLLIFGVIPFLLLHLAYRQVQVWEDDALEKYGTTWVIYAGTGAIDFMARHPVYSWLLFALAVVLGLFAHAYIATHPFYRESKEPPPQELTTTEPLPPKLERLLDVARQPRPLVVPVRYGKITSGPEAGHTGIALKNNGSPAYFVSHPKLITLPGIGSVEIWGTPRDLHGGADELTFPMSRKDKDGSTLGSGLYDFMVKHDLDRLIVPFTYRDGDRNMYQSNIFLIKDQMARAWNGGEAGITLDWEQRQIPAPDAKRLAAHGGIKIEILEGYIEEEFYGSEPAAILRLCLVSHIEDEIGVLRVTLATSPGGISGQMVDIKDWVLYSTTTRKGDFGFSIKNSKYLTLESESLAKELESPIRKGVPKRGWIAFRFSDSSYNQLASGRFTVSVEDALGGVHSLDIAPPWEQSGRVIHGDWLQD